MRYAHAARRYIAITALAGGMTALLVVAQAVLISRSVSPIITSRTALNAVAPLIVLLALVMAARVIILYTQEALAHRAATRTIIELRRHVLQHAAALGPRWQAEHSSDTATLLTRGLDDLEPYFTRYLPQLLLAATVTPLTALVMLVEDLPSAIAVACTIPLIPIFMILIGRLTQHHSEERLTAMERLGGQVLDLLAGLPTLKALGREIGPAGRVRALGRAYNTATMQTLRIAFLSGAVLEFITTLSVAIIAVQVGFRLLFGHMDLATALLVIMIAPEIYQPLRQVGFHFHASANGVAAANAVFEILDTPLPERGTMPAPDLASAVIEIEELSVAARGSWAPAGLTAQIRPGRLVALTGPSGAGKTTTSQVLMSLLPADRGTVRVIPNGADGNGTNGTEAAQGAEDAVMSSLDLSEIEPTTWWSQIAWVPQRPVIVPGTVLDNVIGADRASEFTGVTSSRLGRVLPSLDAAARATGFDEVVSSLPHGWQTRVGQGGAGLSVGQRQRLSLTRALMSDAPLVVLDEPTAHLDAASEAHVLDGVEMLRSQHRTVVVIAHRAALVSMADDVIDVTSRPAREPGNCPHDLPTVPGAGEGTAR